jgi:hypothetical protein
MNSNTDYCLVAFCSSDPHRKALSASKLVDVVEGYMQKKGHRRQDWKRRYIVWTPRDQSLVYYTDNTKKDKRGALSELGEFRLCCLQCRVQLGDIVHCSQCRVSNLATLLIVQIECISRDGY